MFKPLTHCDDCRRPRPLHLLDAYAREAGQEDATAFLCQFCHNLRKPRCAWGPWCEGVREEPADG